MPFLDLWIIIYFTSLCTWVVFFVCFLSRFRISILSLSKFKKEKKIMTNIVNFFSLCSTLLEALVFDSMTQSQTQYVSISRLAGAP